MENKFILITGASGKTGKAVMSALLKMGYSLRAMVHSPEQIPTLDNRIEALPGDLNSDADINHVMNGVSALYHICPNMHPDEVSIGRRIIRAAIKNGVRHFVYHSVLHPQIKEMPHHWKKMQVEGLLFKSGLNFTILQPAVYMQNLLQYKRVILDDNQYAVPYKGNTRIGMVDLRDVAQVAASIIGNASHYGSIYELATDECSNQIELAEKFSRTCQRNISFLEIPRDRWEQTMRKAGMPDYAITSLIRMFRYYELYGFAGNGTTLKMLLGRNPSNLDEFIKEYFTN